MTLAAFKKPTSNFISANDIKIENNSLNYGVKVTHNITGISIEYDKYKSHSKNKIEAILGLKKLLANVNRNVING